MKIGRAAIALLAASVVPGLVSVLVALINSRSVSLSETIVILPFWFLFSVPIVFLIGFPTLYLSLKIKGGPIFIPPIVGGITGLIVSKTIYAQGMNVGGLVLFTLCGIATSLVAMLIYFFPRASRDRQLSD